MTRLDLTDLDAPGSFALLGPGFTGGAWVLVRPLRAATGDEPVRVFLAAYEDRDGRHAAWSGDASEVEPSFPPPAQVDWVLDEPAYPRKVERIRESIAAGDVYQVNLTVRARLAQVSGSSLFSLLCARDVPRFAAWVRAPDGREFVSASPELFFELDGGVLRTEPMKGTARAGAEGALRTSEKDQAELAMITDLVRNDLAPVCVPRSIRVDEARAFVTLPYAVQSVSRVSGTLAAGSTLDDVLRALHPGGSVTGAPKPMALRTIESLEESSRGVYCGTLGFVARGRTTASLLIRTAERTAAGWSYGVGGGIVWDSDAGREWEEIRVKLGALR